MNKQKCTQCESVQQNRGFTFSPFDRTYVATCYDSRKQIMCFHRSGVLRKRCFAFRATALRWLLLNQRSVDETSERIRRKMKDGSETVMGRLLFERHLSYQFIKVLRFILPTHLPAKLIVYTKYVDEQTINGKRQKIAERIQHERSHTLLIDANVTHVMNCCLFQLCWHCSNDISSLYQFAICAYQYLIDLRAPQIPHAYVP